MKKMISVCLALALFCTGALADEGMWLVNAISEALVQKMQAEGLALDGKDIYNADEVALSDAIVSLDFGCTGSMISGRGLLITNHHCAYADVHALSTAEHNYLEDGFWAGGESEEIHIPGKRAYFLQRVLDVTDEVEALIEEQKALGKSTGSRRISHLMETKYSEQTGLDASLSSMWAGSRYYLALYKVYTDIRLVAAPPVSISAFGGDVDNWEWPQHKCDFAMYRIWAAPDGSPAEHSEANVPLKPAKWLKISREGYRPGDFTMVLGYPGRTDRYSGSAEVEFNTSVKFPITNEVRGAQMAIMKKWMDADPEVRLKYSDRFFMLSNVQENNEGMVQCCKRFDVVRAKKKVEKKELRGKQNKQLLRSLEDKYSAQRSRAADINWYRETLIRGSHLAIVATKLSHSKAAAVDLDKEYAGLDMRVEKDLFRYNVQAFYEHVDSSMWGPYQKEVLALFRSADGVVFWDGLCAHLWTDSRMSTADNIYKFFTDCSIRDYNSAVDKAQGTPGVAELGKQYTRALYASRLKEGVPQYPDANSTMRLTYGTVGSFERDGAPLPCQTFSGEILAKENPQDHDFSLKSDWKALLEEDGGVPVNFITDNDITGGNSGSPVLNSKGEIIGLAFDGNKESLCGDVWWVPDYCKCVCVDIRFVLWTLEKYALASAILKEIDNQTPCEMTNPLLCESTLPYGAPQFDKICNCHYLPAFKQGISEGKAEIDAIVSNPEPPTFANTIEALEFSGQTLDRVASIFYNLKEADTNDEMEEIAVQVAPMMTEYSMYISLSEPLFARVKAVYDARESLSLTREQQRLLEKTYKGFVRGGALLSAQDKKTFGEYQEQLSMLELKFGKNSLDATNAFKLKLTDEADLEGLPDYVREMGAATAAENGEQGWIFDLSQPSCSPFLQYSARRDLREKLWMQYNSKAAGGEFDNTEVCRQIVDLRIKIARLLGYETFAQYAIEEHMAETTAKVEGFLQELLEPTLPAARAEVEEVTAFAKAHGFEGGQIMPWDFSYWSEKLRVEKYALSDEELKPYFSLESTIDAVLGLAGTLYGISFEPRPDIPAYHKDVHVFDVKDKDGRHLALFYADFFPRASKRGGAWMTEFRGQSIRDGVERRPFVSIVCNFSKPTQNSPSLLTHYELTTFLHEFGHSLHGMLAEGSYSSMTGTNVDHDFVELPSQIMENWAYEKDYLKSFARHNRTGEVIPDSLIDKIIAAKNYHAAYLQLRQLQFGLLDMAWYNRSSLPAEGTLEFEAAVYEPTNVVPKIPGTCMSTTFSHIFTNNYCAGYYSYKWAEVLAADAYSLFKERGIFNTDVARSFRENVLSRGSSEKEAVLYRNFRGHDPQTRALLESLDIIPANKK